MFLVHFVTAQDILAATLVPFIGRLGETNRCQGNFF